MLEVSDHYTFHLTGSSVEPLSATFLPAPTISESVGVSLMLLTSLPPCTFLIFQRGDLFCDANHAWQRPLHSQSTQRPFYQTPTSALRFLHFVKKVVGNSEKLMKCFPIIRKDSHTVAKRN